jgi:Tfp pilus assembly protein PilW
MIFQDLVLPNMQRSALKKPTLIIILTDGVSSDNVNNTINNIKRITSQSQYGKNAVMFQFVQIGNDRGVPDMFNHIESDNPDIVNYVKNYDIEKAFRSREYCVSRYMVDVLTRFEFDDFDEEMVEERRSVFMERLPM